jgi:hypothetical protein
MKDMAFRKEQLLAILPAYRNCPDQEEFRLSQFNLQRRVALKWLGAALSIPFAGPFLLKALAKETITQGTELSRFLNVSSSVLGIPVSDLDRNVGKVYWAKMSVLPGSRVHLASLQQDALKKTEGSIESANLLPEAHRDFAKKLILVWYTGVVETPKGIRKRVFYNDSLMFKLFSKDRPAPSDCSGSMDSWAKPPTA